MINGTRLRHILGNIEYKPDTEFRICRELDNGWLVQHRQLLHDCKDAESELEWQPGRKWYISKHMTESEVIQTCLLAIITFEEHEAREWFTYCGEKVYGPHIDISKKDIRS